MARALTVTEPPGPLAGGYPAIVPATAADLARIVEIDRLAFADAWGEREWLRELQRPIARLEVLRLSPGAPAAAFVDCWVVCDEVQLLKVATHPDHLRQGLARQLTLGVIASAMVCDMRLVTLEVRRGNLAAIALYCSLGFEQVGLRSRYYPDEEDALLMTLSLSPSPTADEDDEDDEDDEEQD